jgi:hypothetical protein
MKRSEIRGPLAGWQRFVVAGLDLVKPKRDE